MAGAASPAGRPPKTLTEDSHPSRYSRNHLVDSAPAEWWCSFISVRLCHSIHTDAVLCLGAPCLQEPSRGHLAAAPIGSAVDNRLRESKSEIFRTCAIACADHQDRHVDRALASFCLPELRGRSEATNSAVVRMAMFLRTGRASCWSQVMCRTSSGRFVSAGELGRRAAA